MKGVKMHSPCCSYKLILLSVLLVVLLTKGVVPRTTNNVESSEKIYGGERVYATEFPSMAAIMHFRFLFWRFLCGGSIISKKYVLTAAHCFDQRLEDLTVTVGYVAYRYGAQHKITKIMKHENYSRELITNDIAILEVNPPFTFNADKKPAVLPGKYEVTPVGSSGTIVGWGWTESSHEDGLRKAQVQIWNQAECEEAFLNIMPSQICAGGYDVEVSVCYGDSGGPLFVDGILVGITSFMRGCATYVPNVFTRVSYFREWITLMTSV
ncbi:Hypothetical predicted protein [Cloeon dipterum]|uniref:Peptidase S1 domain-containing protein n=1 Tax=Cloeon dipterum TaxID=197152 RepID=A0A8S1D8H3_9INSE|nr:Hypothetical predicted protein [Cloeon dipterum]